MTIDTGKDFRTFLEWFQANLKYLDKYEADRNATICKLQCYRALWEFAADCVAGALYVWICNIIFNILLILSAE